MLCLNNFVIIGTTKNLQPSLASKLNTLTGLRIKDLSSASIKLLIGFQEENCVANYGDVFILFHGIFLDKNLITLINEITTNIESFIKNYNHQGIAALINPKQGTVTVIGDPGSSRTVFYLLTTQTFIISTDMKVLKSAANNLDIQLKRDTLTLLELVLLRSKVSKRTMYKNVNRLFPGEYIIIRTDNTNFEHKVNKYWDITNLETVSSVNKEAVTSSLIKSIVDQLNKYCEETQGSEIAIPVSGGIDSSLLLLLAKKAKKCRQIHAVHTNLENRTELLLSKLITTKAGVPLYIKTLSKSQLKNNYIRLLNDILRLIGYPRENDASLPYLISARSIRARFTRGTLFSIGGDDADSIFGGYDYYKFFATQLLLEKRIVGFLNLIRILKRYNYKQERFLSIMFKIFLQLALQHYALRYRYFKLKSRKLFLKRKKRLNSLIAQYLTELSDPFYNAPIHEYYHKMMARMLVHRSSHLVHARVKTEESKGIITYLPFSSREVIETIMRLSPEYFFFPIGSRSLARLLLKHLGASPTIYLQPKSGFDITNQVLRDPTILSYMKECIKNCWAAKYVKTDNLDPYQIHSLFNVCVMA